jgi:hypothetical protein
MKIKFHNSQVSRVHYPYYYSRAQFSFANGDGERYGCTTTVSHAAWDAGSGTTKRGSLAMENGNGEWRRKDGKM